MKHRELRAALIVAVALTALMNLPTLLRFAETGRPDGALLQSIATEDEARYVSRIKEFIDDSPLMGNPFFVEHKNDLPPGGFAELGIAVPMKLLNLSLQNALALTDILFPILIIALTYLWCFGALKNRWLAIAATLLIIGELRSGLLRETHPKITLIPASLYLLMLFTQERKALWLLLRGILLGIMFHTYPYHWTLFLVFEALQAAWVFKEHRSLTTSLKETLCVFGPFALFAVPWVLWVRISIDPSIVRSAYEHLSLIHTRMPVAPSLQIQLILWIIALGILWKTNISRTKEIGTVFLMLFAGLLAVNSNLITNAEAEFLGHYGRVLWPFLVVAAFLAAKAVLAPRWLKASAVVLSMVGLLCIAESTFRATLIIKETDARFSKYDAVIEYVNANTPKGSVILGSRDFSQILPVSTEQYTFFSYGARFLFVPESELTDRFLAFAALFPEDVDQGDGAYIAVFGNNYGSTYAKERAIHKIRSMLGLEEEPFTNSQADYIGDQMLRQRIDTSLAKTEWNDLKKSLESYRVDFVVTEKPLPSEIQSLFTKITTIDGVAIWKRR